MITAKALENYYSEAKRWQSELTFYQTEVHVLHTLLNKSLSGIRSDENATSLGALLNDLFEWSVADRQVSTALTVQLNTIGGMLNDDAILADNRCETDQNKLRLQMDDLRSEYHQLKSEIYTLILRYLQPVSVH